MKITFIRLALILSVGAFVAAPQQTRADTPFTTFAFSAAGAPTNRTMPARLHDIKNVKDYGAIGNGVTIDTTAILAAVNDTSAPYSTANRGIIYFPPGIYQIDAPIPFELADGITAIAFVGAPGAKIRGNFADALLKRSANSPNGGTYYIESLQLENDNAAGKGILFHSIVGGSIRNVAVSAFVGIETYNSQSITVQDSALSSGGLGGASIGIIAGNSTAIVSTDVSGFATGVQHYNAGLIVHGGRYEVNTVAFNLGTDPNGDAINSSNFSITGVSMESNGTGFYLRSAVSGFISANPAVAQVGKAYGYRLLNVADTVIEGVSFNSAQPLSGHAMSLEGPLARVSFKSVNALTQSVGDWSIAAGLESFSVENCNVELTVAQLPAGARVGTVLPVSNATATTVGTTVVGGGSNHVAVVFSNGVWRII